MYSTFRFPAEDGTSLVGWTNHGDGPNVIIANGLGVPPEAWPQFLDSKCGYNVYGFNHRGSFGSDSPEDPEAIRIDHYVSDTVRLMDYAGIDDAIFVAWSYGVNVTVEMARRYPERVAGMVLVAGVGGGTLEAGFAPLVPKPLRKSVGIAVANAGRSAAPALNIFAELLPKNRATVEAFQTLGLLRPEADPDDIVPWLKAFAQSDFAWYFNMFPAAGEHERVDPSFIDVPAAVAAGKVDGMTSWMDVVNFGKQIPNAEVHVFPATHMLPLEYPDEVLRMTDSVTTKSRLAEPQITKRHRWNSLKARKAKEAAAEQAAKAAKAAEVSKVKEAKNKRPTKPAQKTTDTAEKPVAKKTATKKAVAKKAPAKKTQTEKKDPAKKAPTKKAPAKKK